MTSKLTLDTHRDESLKRVGLVRSVSRHAGDRRSHSHIGEGSGLAC